MANSIGPPHSTPTLGIRPAAGWAGAGGASVRSAVAVTTTRSQIDLIGDSLYHILRGEAGGRLPGRSALPMTRRRALALDLGTAERVVARPARGAAQLGHGGLSARLVFRPRKPGHLLRLVLQALGVAVELRLLLPDLRLRPRLGRCRARREELGDLPGGTHEYIRIGRDPL